MERRPMPSSEDVACPICGEPAPKGARRCDNCGASLGGRSDDGVRKFAESLKVDEATAKKLYESGYRPSETAGKPPQGGTLYLCPSCGAFVSSGDARCGHCGASLAEDGETATAADGRPCPHCGEPIHVAAEVCPSCGKSVARAAEDGVPAVCPECGSLAPTGRHTCAVCGTPLGPTPPTPATKPSPVAEPPLQAPAPVRPRKVAQTPAVPPKTATPRAVAPVAKPAEARRGSSPDRATAPPAKPSAKTEIPPRPPSRRPARPTDAAETTGMARLRELVAMGTAVALPAAAGAAYGNVAGHDWGLLFLFGVLTGIALALTLPDLRPLARRPDLALFVAGLALLVAGPVSAYAGISSRSLDAPTAVLGVALLGLVGWRQRSGIGLFLPWIGGLALLAVLAYAPLATVSAGPFDAGLWAVGGAMALGASALVAYRRWLRAAAEARFLRGDAESARREYEKAIASYDTGIALARRAGRSSAAGWYGRGAALVAVGRHADALAALDRALALDPENEIAWINKGTALARLGRMNEALKCYNSAIKVNPSYEVAWNNKGNTLARLGRHELALECYDRALQIDGGYRTAWVNKGFVLAKLGRFEEAAECADTALRLTDGVAASA